MTTIITREVSGVNATVANRPLLNAEIDTNFISLNNNKVELSEKGVAYGIATLDENSKIPLTQIQGVQGLDGYPVLVSAPEAGDHLEFVVDTWVNVAKVSITDGGNF
jgi:hypothetical protein